MNKTATQSAMERVEEERCESRMHRMHERFRERWAPENDRHEFEADLAMLMQEVATFARLFVQTAKFSLAIQCGGFVCGSPLTD